VRIAEWFRTLRFHEAVFRTLSECGLSRDIPIIVGAHDVGPWCTAIYRRSREFKTERNRRLSKKETEALREKIEWQLKTWRDARSVNAHYDPKGRRHMADRWFADTPFAGTDPLEMSDATSSAS
jgi:hypothetical protein